MNKNDSDASRRSAFKKIAGTAAFSFLASSISSKVFAAEEMMPVPLQGKINHSVCRWCYNEIPFEELCKAAKEIGLSSIELVGPEEWPVMKKYGLTAAMPWGRRYGHREGVQQP